MPGLTTAVFIKPFCEAMLVRHEGPAAPLRSAQTALWKTRVGKLHITGGVYHARRKEIMSPAFQSRPVCPSAVGHPHAAALTSCTWPSQAGTRTPHSGTAAHQVNPAPNAPSRIRVPSAGGRVAITREVPSTPMEPPCFRAGRYSPATSRARFRCASGGTR